MNHALAKRLRAIARPNPGWYALFASLALTAIGIYAIHIVKPHLALVQGERWLPVSLVGMALCMLPKPRAIGHAAYTLLALTLVLLIFLIAPGVPRAIVPVLNGARSWIDLKVARVQPSEFAKISFVLALGWYLRYRNSYRTLRGLLIPFLIMFIPVALILKEPDLGTALLFAPTLFAVLVAAGAKLRHLSALLTIGILAIAINVAIIAFHAPSWMHILEPHQEVRIASMIWPQKYAETAGYQQDVSMRVIGAGGLTGYGPPRAATILHFNRLPYDQNDMIFAVIVDTWGLAGALVVLGLYLLFLASCVLVASRSKDPFARLACVGIAAMIFTQAVINVGVTIGLLPITGITLPFISYGGSSLASTFAMLGLILNFASRRPAPLSRPSFEFDDPEFAAY